MGSFRQNWQEKREERIYWIDPNSDVLDRLLLDVTARSARMMRVACADTPCEIPEVASEPAESGFKEKRKPVLFSECGVQSPPPKS